MIGCLGQSRAAPSRAAEDSDAVARAVAALAALAVIHVVDPPGTSPRSAWRR
jgi:flavin-binding protein dodecin